MAIINEINTKQYQRKGEAARNYNDRNRLDDEKSLKKLFFLNRKKKIRFVYK